MRFIMAGTVHPDPVCRRRLEDYLRIIAERESKSPAFVAVEADEGQFVEIRGQRAKFAEDARAAWPEASATLVEDLALTLMFEPDTHLSMFPSTPVVWLDHGRDEPMPGVVARFCDLRLSCYRHWLGPRLQAGLDMSDDASVERYLSSASVQAARLGPPERSPDRDAKWFTAIEQAAADAPDDAWSVIICGAEHIRNELGNLAELLTLAQYHVEVKDLVGVFD